MTSQDGRVTIVYNGELYNDEVLRAKLESTGVVFRGRSDTETIAELFAAFDWNAVQMPRWNVCPCHLVSRAARTVDCS